MTFHVKHLALAALLLPLPAAAQQSAAPNDSQILSGRSIMFEAEARYFALWSQRLQADLTAAEGAAKAKEEYWKAYVDGLSPETKVGEAK